MICLEKKNLPKSRQFAINVNRYSDVLNFREVKFNTCEHCPYTDKGKGFIISNVNDKSNNTQGERGGNREIRGKEEWRGEDNMKHESKISKSGCLEYAWKAKVVESEIRRRDCLGSLSYSPCNGMSRGTGALTGVRILNCDFHSWNLQTEIKYKKYEQHIFVWRNENYYQCKYKKFSILVVIIQILHALFICFGIFSLYTVNTKTHQCRYKEDELPTGLKYL